MTETVSIRDLMSKQHPPSSRKSMLPASIDPKSSRTIDTAFRLVVSSPADSFPRASGPFLHLIASQSMNESNRLIAIVWTGGK